MGRPKGGKNKTHTKEEKIKYVKIWFTYFDIFAILK